MGAPNEYTAWLESQDCDVQPPTPPWLPQNNPLREDELEARRILRSMPYRDYLKTLHWRWRRQRALWLAQDDRGIPRCQRCRSGVRLQVHHVTEDAYQRRGCEEDADLEVLCDSCHKREHDL